MSFAFGISPDDVSTVLRRGASRIAPAFRGQDIDDLADARFGHIDAGLVERIALDSGLEMVDQTEGALLEIERQLVEQGVLSV